MEKLISKTDYLRFLVGFFTGNGICVNSLLIVKA